MSLSILLIFVFGTLACTARHPTTNGNPPTTPNITFKSDSLVGTFQNISAPTVFYWPTTDENGNKLDRDGIIDIRSKIIANSDAAAAFLAESKKIEAELVEPYYKEFVGMKCGLLVDDLFATPNANAREVADADWKDPENPVEEKAIADCKLTQNTRKKVYGDNVVPVLLKAKEAQQKTVAYIRNENFLPLKTLQVVFGNQPKVSMTGFQGFEEEFSTEATSPFYKVTGAAVDPQNGVMTFTAPAIQLENEIKDADGKIIRKDYILMGEIQFNIEISQSEGATIMGGEFVMTNFFDGTSRKGRLTIVGIVR